MNPHQWPGIGGELFRRLDRFITLAPGDDMPRICSKSGRGTGVDRTPPRIKGSSWTPDGYRNSRLLPFGYLVRGSAWKAMPADLSHGPSWVAGFWI